MKTLRFLSAALIALPSIALGQRVENDFAISNFKFESGQSLTSLRIHYYLAEFLSVLPN